MNIDAAATHHILRIEQAARRLTARGMPEDLALMQLMTTDLHQRQGARRDETRLLPRADTSRSMPQAMRPKSRAPRRPRLSPHMLSACIARADWRHNAGFKHLAQAVAAAYGGLDATQMGCVFGVAPDMITGGLHILRTEGLAGFMARLGCPNGGLP